MLNLNVKQKGVILVFIPVLFQIVFVAILGRMLNQAEVDLKREVRAAKITTLTGELTKLYYDAVTSSIISRSVENQEFKKRYRDALVQIPLTEQNLTALLSEEPNLSATIESIRHDSEEGQKLLLQIASAPRGEDFSNFHRLQRDGRKQVQKLTDDCQQINAYAQQLEAQSPRKSSDTRKIVVTYLLFGVAANVLVALVLASIFVKNVTSRLALISDNARLFKENQPLHKPLAQIDEIGSLVASFHDMAAALSDARQSEQTLIKYAVDVICSVGQDGKFVKVSPSAAKVFGFTPEELQGESVSRVLPADEVDVALKKFRDVISTSDEGTVETSVIRKNGQVAAVRWSIYWSFVEQLLVCVAHDVSNERALEQQKQEVLDMVAHDLRSPLTSLQIILNMLFQGAYGEQTEMAKTRIRKAGKESDRLVRLVSDLLDFDKIESGKMNLDLRQCDLTAAIDSSVNAVSAAAGEKDIRIETELEPELRLHADEDRLVQILVNLVSNAVHYAPSGSAVRITGARTSALVKISIADAGPGIRASEIEKVFERFHQVGKKRHGSGLGLAIAKHIVQSHGGTIGVSSRPNEETVFWFTIPANKPSELLDAEEFKALS